MTRMGVLLLAGYLAWVAAPCRADDVALPTIPEPASGTAVIVTPAPAEAAAEEVVDTAGPPSRPLAHVCGGLVDWAGHLRPSGECARRAWDWMTYRPQSCSRCCSGCGRTCAPTCVPPLYTYFLWQCQAGCGGTVTQGSEQ